MLPSRQFSFFATKGNTKAYRRWLECICEWAVDGFVRLASEPSRSPRPKNLLKTYESVLRGIWKLYQYTGDTSLADGAYETVRISLGLNNPTPFYLAGQQSTGVWQRREANEKLLFAYCVACVLKPKKPYKHMREGLNGKLFQRSANAIPMRISALLAQFKKNEDGAAERVIRRQLEAYKVERFSQRNPLKFISVRESTLGNGSPFTVLTSEEENFVRALWALVPWRNNHRPDCAQ
jgi:hypothetical protein